MSYLINGLPSQSQPAAAILKALPSLKEQAPEAVVAVDVRHTLWLTPEFVAVLRECGATGYEGAHAKQPPSSIYMPGETLRARPSNSVSSMAD